MISYTIISIHNHSGNSAPSIADINSAYRNKYKYGLIACHNGKLFKYSISGQYDPFNVSLILDKVDKILYNPNGIDYAALKKSLDQLLKEHIELEVYGLEL